MPEITDIAACAVMVTSSMVGMSASEIAIPSYTSIDSVTEDNGSSDDSLNFSEITGTYLQGGSAYIADTGNKSATYYKWNVSNIGKIFYQKTYCKAVVGAYLRDSRFTDPYAKYAIQISGFVSKDIGTIDQDAAKNGWNYIESDRFAASADSGNYILSCSNAYVYPSSYSGYETGADAIYIELFHESYRRSEND